MEKATTEKKVKTAKKTSAAKVTKKETASPETNAKKTAAKSAITAKDSKKTTATKSKTETKKVSAPLEVEISEKKSSPAPKKKAAKKVAEKPVETKPAEAEKSAEPKKASSTKKTAETKKVAPAKKTAETVKPTETKKASESKKTTKSKKTTEAKKTSEDKEDASKAPEETTKEVVPAKELPVKKTEKKKKSSAKAKEEKPVEEKKEVLPENKKESASAKKKSRSKKAKTKNDLPDIVPNSEGTAPVSDLNPELLDIVTATSKAEESLSEFSEKKDESLSDAEEEIEIQETLSVTKKGKSHGKKVTISEMAKGDKELLTLDDVKAHFLEVGKKNDGTVKQSDIEKYTSHLALSDDDFDSIITYLDENGILLDNEEDEEEELPPENDEDTYSDNDNEDEFEESAQEAEEEEMMSTIDVKNSDPVRQYLHSIGTYQVLKTKEEEDALARRIEAGNIARAILAGPFGEISSADNKATVTEDIYEALTDFPAEVKEDRKPDFIGKNRRYMEFYMDDGKEAKDLLIECNLKLVVSIAKHYVNRGMEFLDLIQEGNLGLMKAVDKFDYHKGFKFSTYATWWIRQAITRALADQARTIRIPVHMVETINKITRAQRKLVQKLNRDPTAEEISEELGGQWSATRIREIQQIALDPLSLEKPVGEEEDSHVADFIEDRDNISPYEYANRSMQTERINEVLKQLTDREARVIRLRYGLEDGRTHTLEDVGKEFNVTRERIRQIEAKALKKLRHPARAKLLKDYRND